MKISFYELFDLMAEEALELLSEEMAEGTASPSSEDTEDATDRDSTFFSAETTINGVLEMISQKEHPHVTKKKKAKFRLLLVAVIGAGLSAAAVALADQPIIINGIFQKPGAEEINDTNQEYVGKGLKAADVTVDSLAKAREEAASRVKKPKKPEIRYEIPGFIKSIESEEHLPYAMDTFEARKENGYYTTPEVIFTNNAMVIFTKEGNKGWKLKKGQTLHFKAEEYPSEVTWGRGQAIIYTHILDGKLMNQEYDGHGRHGLSQKYDLPAEKDGEYYLCLIGASSDSISLKNGRLYVD